MNKLLKVALGATALVSGSLFAEQAVSSSFNPYVAVKGGIAKLGNRDNVKYKTGSAASVEAGVSYDTWRLGLEVAYRQAKIKESNNLELNRAAAYAAADATHAAAYAAGAAAANVARTAAYAAIAAADVAAVANKAKDAKYNVLAGMVNVYYDYALTDEVALYAGLGLGVARTNLKFKGSELDTSKTVFAWQLMAGVSYDINENWTVEAGYRLFNTAKIKMAENVKFKTPMMHTAEIGLRYNF